MRVTDKTRKKLHELLDQLLDEDVEEPEDGDPDRAGVLIIRESLSVASDSRRVECSLSIRGIVGRKAASLREVIRQINEQK